MIIESGASRGPLPLAPETYYTRGGAMLQGCAESFESESGEKSRNNADDFESQTDLMAGK